MTMTNARVMISACLLGLRCRYDGRRARRQLQKGLVTVLGYRLIPVCPEQLGGLSTPREPMSIVGGDGYAVLTGKARVITATGLDCTAALVRGSQEALFLVRRLGAKRFVGQRGSPSCCCGLIGNAPLGCPSMTTGVGVCAALLAQSSIQAIDVAMFERGFQEIPG